MCLRGGEGVGSGKSYQLLANIFILLQFLPASDGPVVWEVKTLHEKALFAFQISCNFALHTLYSGPFLSVGCQTRVLYWTINEISENKTFIN